MNTLWVRTPVNPSNYPALKEMIEELSKTQTVHVSCHVQDIADVVKLVMKLNVIVHPIRDFAECVKLSENFENQIDLKGNQL